jgi:hypothetical protein
MRAVAGNICVMTADGFAVMCQPDNLAAVYRPKKLHNMPLTSCTTIENGNTLVTASTDYSYKFTKMSDFSFFAMVKGWLFQFALLFLVLVFLVDYLY